MVKVADLCAELGFCNHLSNLLNSYKNLQLRQCGKSYPGSFLVVIRAFEKEYKSRNGTPAFDLRVEPPLDREPFLEMVDAFFELHSDIIDTYWPSVNRSASSEGLDISE